MVTADFQHAGDEGHETDLYDITPDTSGEVADNDDDGDRTIRLFGPPPMPANHIAVDPQHEQVVGWQWGAGNQVTVQIDDDADFSSLLYTKVNVDVFDDGDGISSFWLNLDGVFDVTSDHFVRVIDQSGRRWLPRTRMWRRWCSMSRCWRVTSA